MDDQIDIKIEENIRTDPYYLGLIPICVLVIIVFVRVTFVLCKSYDYELSGQDDGTVASTVPKSGVIFFSIFFSFLALAFIGFAIMYYRIGQKTRAPPQRRMYMGPRARQSLSQAEPTIYVSPNNLPPPPKYECLAPPSYEEVVGIHYPQYQSQPITHPITSAMAQSGQTSSHGTTDPPTVVTVTSETRTSVQVAAS